MEPEALLDHRPGGLRGHRRRPQVDRARHRRRARLDRSRHRHRHHLRQGDRVRRPSARDEGRAAEHPLARLRADRGRRVLHVHLRPDRLLPLGLWSSSATSPRSSSRPPPRAARGEEDGGSFLVSPGLGLMIWTLLAFGVTMLVLKKYAFPKISDALEERAAEDLQEHRGVGAPARRGRRAARRVPRAPQGGPRAGRRHRRPRAARPARPRRRRRPTRAGRSARSSSPPPARTSRPRRSARSRRSARRSPT